MAQKPERDDVRLSELMSWNDAMKVTGRTRESLRHRIFKGGLTRVILPDRKNSALLKKEVKRLIKYHIMRYTRDSTLPTPNKQATQKKRRASKETLTFRSILLLIQNFRPLNHSKLSQ